ncbi:hypothetical protein ACFLVS_03450 [Chloroflexota bacterium]
MPMLLTRNSENRLRTLFVRAKDVLQKEGLVAFLGWARIYVVPHFVQYATFYLYELTIKERNKADFMPRIQNFTLKTVSTNQQAGELIVDGFNLSSDITRIRQGLEKGAIAFCIFVERELAHIGWVAMTEEARNNIDPLPYQVDFSNKEDCAGDVRTISKYQGKGLMTYGLYERSEFLRKKGVIISRFAVAVSNIASRTACAKFDPKIYAKARYLKILRWQSWKETPLMLTNHQDLSKENSSGLKRQKTGMRW